MENERIVQLLEAGGWKVGYVCEEKGELKIETRALVAWGLTADGDTQPLVLIDSLIEPVTFADLTGGWALLEPGAEVGEELKRQLLADYRKAHPARREKEKRSAASIAA